MDRTTATNYVLNSAGKRVFRDRNLAAGLPGTQITAADLIAWQEEILAVIEGAGLTPDATNLAQMLAALRVLFAAKAGSASQAFAVANGTSGNNALAAQQFTFSAGGAGWAKIPMNGGLNFIIQWGGTTFVCPGAGITTTAFTLPMTYPTSHMFSLANYSGTSPPGSVNSVAASASSLSQITLSMYAPGTSSYGLTYLSMGY